MKLLECKITLSTAEDLSDAEADKLGDAVEDEVEGLLQVILERVQRKFPGIVASYQL